MMWFNYIFSFFIPITFILIGFIFWKHAPKTINGTAGWRTKHAVTNQETWNFANMLGGKCTLILGGVEFLVSLIFLLLTLNLNEVFFAIEKCNKMQCKSVTPFMVS